MLRGVLCNRVLNFVMDTRHKSEVRDPTKLHKCARSGVLLLLLLLLVYYQLEERDLSAKRTTQVQRIMPEMTVRATACGLSKISCQQTMPDVVIRS